MSLLSFLVYDCNLIGLRYWQKNKRVRALYSNSYDGKYSHMSRLVAMANTLVHNGGLGDRIHGFISLYMFCEKYGYEFKINNCDNFRLSSFFEPNEVDWNVNPDDIIYDLNVAEPVLMPCTFKKYNGSPDQEARFMNRYLRWRIRKNPQKEIHVYTNEHWACTPEIYSHYFHKLFKPSKALQEAVNREKNRIGGSYISVTLRFQNLLGDFYEGKYPTLPQDEQNVLMKKVLDKISELHSQLPEGEEILVTSDSRSFLDYVQQESYVHTIPGRIVHMSYSDDKDFAVHLKSFVDLMMLADATKLYLLVTGSMFHSGFAESASFINNRPYEVIKF